MHDHVNHFFFVVLIILRVLNITKTLIDMCFKSISGHKLWAGHPLDHSVRMSWLYRRTAMTTVKNPVAVAPVWLLLRLAWMVLRIYEKWT